jgi:hypothetical protein
MAHGYPDPGLETSIHDGQILFEQQSGNHIFVLIRSYQDLRYWVFHPTVFSVLGRLKLHVTTMPQQCSYVVYYWYE